MEADKKDPLSLTTMCFRQSNLPDTPCIMQQMKKKSTTTADDPKFLLEELGNYPRTLTAPGIKPIKKNELWQKYLKLVPEQYHHLDIYKPPTEEEKEELKQSKKRKSQINQEEKESRKRRQEALLNV